MKKRKKTIVFIILGCLFATTPVVAMMAVDDSGTTSSVSRSTAVQKKTIFLLSWDDNFLQTSQGALSTIGVKIVNHSDIDRRDLSRLKKLPIIKFITQDNRVIEADIYPSP